MKIEGVQRNNDFIRLLFLGGPLLDVTAYSSQETLENYGLKSDDCIRETEKQKSLFQSLLGDHETHMSAGGSSQNTARIAKWILRDKADVSFTGCVGKDDLAVTMRHQLQSEGVEPLYISLSEESTGVCLCLLNYEGDRSMCARLGAAERFASHHLSERSVQKKLQSADCVFVEGYFFAHSPDVMLSLVETCPQNQVLSLSLSAEYICRQHTDIFLRVLPRVDVLLSNEAEAKAVAEALGIGHLTVEEIASVLATRDRPLDCKPRIVLVTRGPNPVIIARGTDTPLSFPIPSGVKVIDSVGCGDALAGAFLAVFILTGNISRAVKTGILAAVEIAQVSGCNPPNKILYPLNNSPATEKVV